MSARLSKLLVVALVISLLGVISIGTGVYKEYDVIVADGKSSNTLDITPLGSKIGWIMFYAPGSLPGDNNADLQMYAIWYPKGKSDTQEVVTSHTLYAYQDFAAQGTAADDFLTSTAAFGYIVTPEKIRLDVRTNGNVTGAKTFNVGLLFYD